MPPSSASLWFRSTAFRLFLLQMAVLATALVGASVGGWFVTRNVALADARDHVLMEYDAVVSDIGAGGADRAASVVAARTRLPGAFEYGLHPPGGGGSSTGELPRLEPGLRTVAEAGIVGHSTDKGQLLAFTGLLPDGSVFTVAEDMDRAEALRRNLLRTLFVWDGLALLVSLLLGLLLTRRALSRMNRINAALDRVAAGDLSARIDVGSTARTDMDDLSRGVNHALDQINHLVGALRQVSAEVAHDLRTPLSHVRQRLELARTATTAEARDAAIDGARTGLAAALAVFDAMLRLAEIRAGAARERFASLALDEVAADVVDAWRADIEAAGGAVLLEAPEPCPMTGDAELLVQALSNLMENALRHGRSPTMVTVSAGRGFVELCVRDHGQGIAEARREAALRPFGRLDPARTTPGSGLGLPIVAAVARLHGGEMRLENADPGLCVRLRFATNVPDASQD